MSDLRDYVTAISTMFAPVEEMVRDGQGNPPWSILFSIDNTPRSAYAWLAQWVGVTLDQKSVSETDDAYYARQRNKIREVSGQGRGTLGAMTAAAQQYLTGNKTVMFRERDPDAYSIIVITLDAETPNPDAVNLALISQKPAGIIMDYHTLTGNDYQLVKDADTNYAGAKARWITYQGMVEGAAVSGSSSALVPGSTTLPGTTTIPSP